MRIKTILWSQMGLIEKTSWKAKGAFKTFQNNHGSYMFVDFHIQDLMLRSKDKIRLDYLQDFSDAFENQN